MMKCFLIENIFNIYAWYDKIKVDECATNDKFGGSVDGYRKWCAYKS